MLFRSGRKSNIVDARANELKVTYVKQGIKNKKEVLSQILEKEGLGYENVAGLGDDLNDLGMLLSVKWSFCPNNASKQIKDVVKTILNSNGGNGAVREMIEIILKEQNQEQEFLKLWQ